MPSADDEREKGTLRAPDDRMSLLLAHGLRETEARVYVALLDHRSMTAATLARLADVPRSHLYKVLHDLQGAGLVEILLQGAARSYRARPLRGFLERRAHDLRRRLDELDRAAVRADDFLPPPLDHDEEHETGDVRIVVGRRAVAREIDALIAAATDEVVVAASQGGFERALRHAAPFVMDQHAGAATRFHVLLPSHAEGNEWTARIGSLPHVALRWLDVPRSILTVVQDACKVLCVTPIPDTNDMRTGRDFAIYSGDRAFSADYRRLLLAASREEDVSGPPGRT